MKYKNMSKKPFPPNDVEKRRLDECLDAINTDLLERNISVGKYGELVSGLMLFEFGVINLQELNARF
jgi:hypothetical protein